MKKNSVFLSFMLCLALACATFSGCGKVPQSTSLESGSETVSTPEVEKMEKLMPEKDFETSAEEDALDSSVEKAVPQASIDYPLDGDYSFRVLYSKPTILDATILSGKDYDTSIAWEPMIEATGVTLEWESVSEQAWNTQISLIMAAGDYPDACASPIEYATGKTGLVEDEIMLDLSGYVADHMPNYDALLTEDTDFANCVYEANGMLVQILSRAKTFINSGLNVRQDWLNELGMEVPTTLDELTSFLLACKDKYGLTNAFEMTADLNIGLNRAFNVKCEGDRMLYQLKDENSDEIVWSATTENFRDYIEFLRSYYEQGIFNDDYLNISNENGNVQSTFLSGSAAAWTFDCSALVSDAVDGIPVADLKLYNDETTNISGVTERETTRNTTGMIMVFSACEEPEVFCEFLDYFFTEEGNLLANWGVEGESYILNENGDPDYTDMVWSDTECFFFLLRNARYGLYWAPCDFDVDLMIADYTEEQRAAVDMWVATRGSYLCYPPNFQLSTEDREIVNTYETDCNTYFWENVYKIIVGQLTMEDFDQVVQTTLDMGMQQAVDAYNHSYKEYLSQKTA